MRRGGEKQQGTTTIGGVVAALDQAALLHFVQQAHQGDRLDFQQVGQAFLMNAFMDGKLRQDLPLRTREVGCACPLFKAFAHQAGDVMEDKAKGGLGHCSAHLEVNEQAHGNQAYGLSASGFS
ncbi:hypothetical protein D9M71_749800 [compost metagenome]